ncbi:hypothetical protein Tco_0779197 [Tanacetum coccineum]
MSKYDMSTTFSDLTQDSLGTLVKIYHIPLDLRPRLPDPDHFIDHLPNDAIGIYTRFLRFFEVRIPFSTFLLSVLKYFKVYISQLFPLGLNKNHTTAPATEGAHIPQPTPEEVVTSQPNPKLSKNSKALTKRKVSTSLVGPFEAAQPKRKRRLKSKASEAGFSALAAEQADDADDANLSENDYCACTYLEDTLEREEGNSFIPVFPSGKRLGSPLPRPSNTGHSDLGHTGTSNAAIVPSFGHADVYQGTAPSALSRDREYDDIPDDDFSSAT